MLRAAHRAPSHCLPHSGRRAARAARAAAAPAAGSSTAQAQAQAFEGLAAWLSSRGGSVGPISVGDCRMGPATVRGLVATRDVAANEPLLSVPVSATLRDDAAGEAYPGAPWNANLAAQLLAERDKGGASALAPYLQTLPAAACSPLLLSEPQLEQVQYRPALAALAAYRAFAAAAYGALSEARAAAGLPPWSWADWVWALHMVQSRSIRLAITGCKVMVPGIDLLNHGGAAANGQLVLGSASWQVGGERAVCFVTSHPIAAGEQVLWSYGQRSNDDFFACHGFVLEPNPDEDVILWQDVAALAHWALQSLPQLQQAARGADCQAMAASAEAAAVHATQQASARASSAAIQGTASSLLAPLPQLLAELRRGPGQARQRDAAAAAAGPCEATALSGLRGLQLQRRLASFRLHTPEWGTPACAPLAAELAVQCADGLADVRVPAVLAALLDAAAPGQDHASGRELASCVQGAVVQRARELLAGFATSAEEDVALLAQAHAPGSSGEDAALLAAVIAYRRGKKLALAQLLRQLE